MEEEGNPSLHLLHKLLHRRHSRAGSRPAPGKHEVALLQLAPQLLVPAFNALLRKAFDDFVRTHFDEEEEKEEEEERGGGDALGCSTSSSSLSRPAFFVGPSHAKGKVIVDPFKFAAERCSAALFQRRKLLCDVVSAGEPGGRRQPSIFVLAVRRA